MLRFKAIEPALVTRGHYPFEDNWSGVHNPFVCHFDSQPHNVTSTSTSTSTPWGPQQPYLQSGFGFAGNLLNSPAPEQIYPVAPLNDVQLSALGGITGLAGAGTPISTAATGFDTNLENGAFLGANPALGYFTSLAGNNIGLNNPGATALEGIVGANPAASLPGNAALTGLATTNLGSSSPGAALLSDLSGTNFGTQNGGTPALADYASGKYLNSNPYGDDVAKSIEAQVIPSITSAFNAGGNVNNPAMALAAAQGVTSALAPLEYQNFQQQEQLQQGAANSLASNTLAGATAQGTFANLAAELGLSGGQLSEGAANALNSGFLTGTELQSNAASALSGNAVSGANAQTSAAEGISQPFQQTLTNMVQGNLAAPGNQALSYADLDKLLQAGTIAQQQRQAELTGGAQSFNYSQLSPYQQLAAYMQAVDGAYGGTTSGTNTTPYFSNPASSAIGGVLGLNSIGSALGIGGSAGPLGALGGWLGLGGGAVDAGAAAASTAGITDGLLAGSSALLPGAADAGAALLALL